MYHTANFIVIAVIAAITILYRKAETVLNNSQNKNREIIEPIEFFDTPRIQSPTEIAGMAGYIKHLNGQNYPSQTPRHSTAELKYLFTETENNDTACAGMLYQIIGDDAIYSGQCYYIWNGYVWSMISKEVFKHYVISILETRFNYVKRLQGYENLDYVGGCCNNGKINSITAILQTYITIDPRILNNDTGLLCVRNGVIDFTTRRLLPHYTYKKNYLTAKLFRIHRGRRRKVLFCIMRTDAARYMTRGCILTAGTMPSLTMMTGKTPLFAAVRAEFSKGRTLRR